MKKKYIIIEILVYIILLIILLLPIVIKVNEKNKNDKINNDILEYIKYIDKNIDKTNDGTYYKKIDKLNSYNIELTNEEYVIKNGNVYRGSFCYKNHQINYLDKKIISVSNECNDSSEKIKNAKIKIEIEDLNNCSKTKKINIKYDEIKGAKLEYRLYDINGNILDDWTEFRENLNVNQDGKIYVRLKNDFISSDIIEATIKNIDIDNIKVEKPIIKELHDDKVVLENEIKKEESSDACKLDYSTVEYGYSTTKDGKYIYQKDNQIKIDKNKKYYFKTRVMSPTNDKLIESKPYYYESNNKCVINVLNEDEITTNKTVVITPYNDDEIYYKINDGEWINYEFPFNIDTEFTNIYCKINDEIYSYTITKGIDSIPPTKPVIKMYKGNFKLNDKKNNLTNYDNEETDEDIKVVVKSKDSSGIKKYQFSYDLNSWIDIETTDWYKGFNNDKSEFYFWITWPQKKEIYIRSIDNPGNISEVSKKVIINKK